MWMEPFIILGVGAIISLGLFAYYQPKINKLKEQYDEFSKKMSANMNQMSEDERKEFFKNMPKDTESFMMGMMNHEDNFNGIDSFDSARYHMDFMQQEQFDQFSQWSMDEAMKAVTPFDHGGYVQGNGFNPSDTIAYESAMDSMNHSMDSMNSSMDINNGF